MTKIQILLTVFTKEFIFTSKLPFYHSNQINSWEFRKIVCRFGLYQQNGVYATDSKHGNHSGKINE